MEQAEIKDVMNRLIIEMNEARSSMNMFADTHSNPAARYYAGRHDGLRSALEMLAAAAEQGLS
jgi:hypothetical protein